MHYRWILTILFGLFVIWTGLLRSIEAQAFKPNAFWFCLVTGLIAIVGAFLFRGQRKWPAIIVSLIAAVTVLAFYLNCLIVQPEKDATVRVALAILAAVGELCVIATAVFPAKSEQTKA